jgi:hypothetical protein
LVNSIYLIFVYVAVSFIASLVCHKYVHAWVMGLYGQVPHKLMEQSLSSKLLNRDAALDEIPEEEAGE